MRNRQEAHVHLPSRLDVPHSSFLRVLRLSGQNCDLAISRCVRNEHQPTPESVLLSAREGFAYFAHPAFLPIALRATSHSEGPDHPDARQRSRLARFHLERPQLRQRHDSAIDLFGLYGRQPMRGSAQNPATEDRGYSVSLGVRQVTVPGKNCLQGRAVLPLERHPLSPTSPPDKPKPGRSLFEATRPRLESGRQPRPESALLSTRGDSGCF